MTRDKPGAKTGRAERHAASQRALKERKHLRRKRAAIHAAMGKAARMQRSKRKGTRDFEANMQTLGFDGDRTVPGDVTAKYEARS